MLFHRNMSRQIKLLSVEYGVGVKILCLYRNNSKFIIYQYGVILCFFNNTVKSQKTNLKQSFITERNSFILIYTVILKIFHVKSRRKFQMKEILEEKLQEAEYYITQTEKSLKKAPDGTLVLSKSNGTTE